MDQKIREQVEQALIAAEAVGPELAYLPEVEESIASGKSPSEAVKELAALRPVFFAKKDFAEMDPDEFEKSEEKFRLSLRKSRPAVPNAFSSLDSATLTRDEMSALDRVVTGQGDSFDRSVLTSALARQKAEAKLINGDAA
jgi:hypothetical protein